MQNDVYRLIKKLYKTLGKKKFKHANNLQYNIKEPKRENLNLVGSKNSKCMSFGLHIERQSGEMPFSEQH